MAERTQDEVLYNQQKDWERDQGARISPGNLHGADLRGIEEES